MTLPGRWRIVGMPADDDPDLCEPAVIHFTSTGGTFAFARV